MAMMQEKSSCMLLALIAIATLYFVLDMTTRNRAPRYDMTPMSQLGSACSAAMASKTQPPAATSARAAGTAPEAGPDPKQTVGGPRAAMEFEDNNPRVGMATPQPGICMPKPPPPPPESVPCNREIEI